MAELGTGSTPRSDYPGALDTNTTQEVDSPSINKTVITAAKIDDGYAAIINIQAELGIDPAGTKTTVKEFLQTEHDADGTHKASLVLETPALQSYATADLPTASTDGRLAGVADGIRGIWKDTGTAWVSVTGEANVRDFTDVPTAVTALGSTVATLVIPNTQVVASNLTIPATLTLAFTDQGQLSVSSGATVTILGPLVAPMRQIFSGASTAPVLFGTGSVEQLYPEWFGAKGDGVVTYDTRVYVSGTDDSAALQAAFNASMNSTFRPKVVLSARLYYHTTPLTITFARGMHIEGGAGGQFGDTDTGFRDMVTTLFYNGSGANTSGITIGNGSQSATGFVMDHVFVNAGSLAEVASGVNGIRLNWASGATFRDVAISNFKGAGAAGLLIEGTQLASFYNLGFTNNTIGSFEKGTAQENTTNRFYNCVWHTNGTGYYGTGSTGTLLQGPTFQNQTASAVSVTSTAYNTNSFTMRDYYIASNASASAVPAVDLQGSATYTLWNPRIEGGFFASAGATQTASIRYTYSRQGIISHPRMGDITNNKFFVGTTNLEFMFLGWNSSLGNAFLEDGAGVQVPWPRLGVEQPYFLTSYSPFKALQGKTDLNTAALTVEQGNVSKALVNFVGTTEAGVSKNLTSWATGATLAGFTKMEINGTAYWMPFYNAPTGP